MSDDYSVYCLYTEIGGVFYVGCGRRKSRLKYTVKECEQASRSICMKCLYIRACQARRIKIHIWVISSCSDKQRAEEVEYALIQMYPYALTNSALNWRPMKHFPKFLQGLPEQPEFAGKAGVQHLRDSGSGLFNENDGYASVKTMLKPIQQAVDAILAHNNAVTQPSLRWYINEEVVHDLLGGRSSGIKTYYLIERYLSSRRDELEAHHRQHGLTPEQNQKRIRITEQVKVEPVVAGEHYTIRLRRAVDAILVYNDAVSVSELRWYICANVVHDLLGGRSSGTLSYLVEQYLASRRDGLEAHHRQYGLKPSHNRKLRSISEWVKIELAY